MHLQINGSDINPDTEEFIIDDSPRTCTTFNSGDDTNIPRNTIFRIEVADYRIDYVNVTLIGTNLGCGHNLYVTPLSAADTEKWTEETKYEDKERCSYGCRCRGSCEEIQVFKRPKIIKDSSWNLCYICTTPDYLDQYGCEVDPTKAIGVYSTHPTYLTDPTVSTKKTFIVTWKRMMVGGLGPTRFGVVKLLSYQGDFEKKTKAPWWYCRFTNVVLTGQYGERKNIISAAGIRWRNT
ncbi:hypothetical protein LSH36_1g05010 [Paralvinella palmiformis]|uniref:Uncharacterized protein n=1 Tax=Paralvinella palmiformis TaxID=53620 RepID=A0AAD9KG10_9ANNE|nr:hypothetical protein LSH36_1g05010 [Paralvinella palmiformis]